MDKILANEMRQPLCVVIGRAALAKRRLAKLGVYPEVEADLDAITAAGWRLNGMVDQAVAVAIEENRKPVSV